MLSPIGGLFLSWTKKASSDSADEKEPAHPSLIEAFAVGVIAGAMAQLLKFGVAALGTLRVHLAERVPPDLVLPMMGLIGGLLCGVIIQKVAPDITGSGIPQVKATLRGTKAIGLQLKDLLSKLVGGILALGCGMPLGREGPTVQMGAAVAYLCNRLGIGQNKLGRHFIAAGAGAGLAAAFNAPLAGMIFVVEELVREVKSQFVIAAGLACFGATVILRLVSVHSLDISPRSEFPAVVVTAQDIPSLAVLGIICGALGAVFNSLIIRGCLLTNKAFGKNFPLRIGLAGLICGVVVGLMPQAFRDFAGIKYMFVAADPGLQMGVTVLVTNFILTVLAYAAGAPGGLFGPSLTIGAALGYLMSTAHGFLPGGSIQSQSVLAIAGMGSFFSGVARVPITATVIVFELTHDFNVFLPLLMGSMVAYVVAEKLYPGSIYDRLLSMNDDAKESHGAKQALSGPQS